MVRFRTAHVRSGRQAVGILSQVLPSKQRMLPCLMAGLLGVLAGCATVDPPPDLSAARRDDLASVAVVHAQFQPQAEFLVSWRHKEGAAGKQAALTAAGAAAGTAAAATAWLGPVAVVSGAIAGAAMVIREAVVTEKNILPASTAAELESAISTAIAGQNVQAGLAGQLAKMVEVDPQVRLAVVSVAGPVDAEARPDYASLRNSGVGTVIETAITEIGFEGCIAHDWECMPPHVLYLIVRAQARLVRVTDGTVLLERPLEYKSGHHELSYWLADGGRSLGDEIGRAIRTLAESLHDEIFLITPIALPNSSGSGCWLEPIYPKFDFMHGSRVDSLQPMLRWSAFPRDIDREKLDPEVLSRISNVVYDLRIWDESAYLRAGVPWERWRNQVVYERAGLEAPQHTLEMPLEPGVRYYWSVRARFVIDGRPMATRWARRRDCFSDEVVFGLHDMDTPKL